MEIIRGASHFNVYNAGTISAKTHSAALKQMNSEMVTQVLVAWFGCMKGYSYQNGQHSFPFPIQALVWIQHDPTKV